MKSLLNLILSAAFIILINISKAQTQEHKLFKLCNETTDTVHIADLDNCAELIPIDSKMKVILFTITVKHGETIEDYDPNVGGVISKELIAEIKKMKNLNYIQVRDIVAKEGKIQKKYKGFTVFVR